MTDQAEPVLPRQPHIEQNQGGNVALDFAPQRHAVAQPGHAHPLPAEILNKQLTLRHLVLDHEYTRGYHHAVRWTPLDEWLASDKGVSKGTHANGRHPDRFFPSLSVTVPKCPIPAFNGLSFASSGGRPRSTPIWRPFGPPPPGP